MKPFLDEAGNRMLLWRKDPQTVPRLTLLLKHRTLHKRTSNICNKHKHLQALDSLFTVWMVSNSISHSQESAFKLHFTPLALDQGLKI
jgi:hypothetical protein